MMDSSKTMNGPDTYREMQEQLSNADDASLGSSAESAYLQYAQVHATNAQTAAIVMLTEVVATAKGVGHYGLDAWREVIPMTPLRECRSKFTRRPECAERHTEDCAYADPPVEPKHELLPVGTRVLVSDLVWNEETQKPERNNPQPGRISGYAGGGHKYRWQGEYGTGYYSTHESFAFADNRVEVHPDGPECPLAPQPVKQEPTGPVLYVKNLRGKQGRILQLANQEDKLVGQVQWFAPGAQPVWVHMDTLRFIASEDVDRCENGQTGDECGSGENQCELCLQAEDEEGDKIEESMGLR